MCSAKEIRNCFVERIEVLRFVENFTLIFCWVINDSLKLVTTRRPTSPLSRSCCFLISVAFKITFLARVTSNSPAIEIEEKRKKKEEQKMQNYFFVFVGMQSTVTSALSVATAAAPQNEGVHRMTHCCSCKYKMK